MNSAFKIFTLLFFPLFLITSCTDDEPCIETVWYEDIDSDGLGNANISRLACNQPDGFVADNTDVDDTDDSNAAATVLSVNSDFFTSANANTVITVVNCTLSDGTQTECYQITSNSTPTDHQMGPWCPDNITDDASAGGIWLEGGEVFDVDGAFVENMASFYNDASWSMYDADGKIYKTLTQEDCTNAANPNVGEDYKNFCVECLPSYISDVSVTFTIPKTPVMQDLLTNFANGPGGPPGTVTTPSTRGIALNGVEFSAPAPIDNILGAYTLAPFDDAGGHINVNQGYHYHAATGMSFSIPQTDGHAALIGYAMDGHGIYETFDEDGLEPDDLDNCRGHFDAARGYHYHIDKPGNNNFINCLAGAWAN